MRYVVDRNVVTQRIPVLVMASGIPEWRRQTQHYVQCCSWCSPSYRLAISAQNSRQVSDVRCYCVVPREVATASGRGSTDRTASLSFAEVWKSMDSIAWPWWKAGSYWATCLLWNRMFIVVFIRVCNWSIFWSSQYPHTLFWFSQYTHNLFWSSQYPHTILWSSQ